MIPGSDGGVLPRSSASTHPRDEPANRAPMTSGYRRTNRLIGRGITNDPTEGDAAHLPLPLQLGDLAVRAPRCGAQITDSVPGLLHDEAVVLRIDLEHIDGLRRVGWPCRPLKRSPPPVPATDLEQVLLDLEVSRIGEPVLGPHGSAERNG